MANYLLVYRGGQGVMPSTPEEGQKIMDAWMGWFGGMGEAVVDGGNPTSVSKTVSPGGAVSEGNSGGVSGYSVLKANSLDEAVDLAKGCPHLQSGGTVEVYETFNPM